MKMISKWDKIIDIGIPVERRHSFSYKAPVRSSSVSFSDSFSASLRHVPFIVSIRIVFVPEGSRS